MRRRNKKKSMLLVLLMLIASVSMGYAILNTTLNINGTSKIKDAKWNIYWENPSVSNGSIVSTLPTIDSLKTTASFDVTLNNPGDYYEFLIDARNAGTIDAMISEIHYKLNNSEIGTNNQLPAYINYTVTKSDDTALEINQRLNAGEKETYKVRVEFKKDIANNQLPQSEVELQLDFSVEYVQAEGSDNSGSGEVDNDTSDDPNAVMNLAQSGQLKVGDIVTYNPGTHSITLLPSQTGLDEIDTNGSYSEYYNISQTLSTTDRTRVWRVFSIDNATGVVKIAGLVPENDDESYNLKLYGKAGFANSVSLIEQVASMYGDGYGAKSVRSMTLNDIGTAIGVDYSTRATGGNSFSFTSGRVFTQNALGFSSDLEEATSENPITINGSQEVWAWSDLNQKIENSTGEQQAYYEIINDMIYNDYSTYWLADRYVSVDTYNNGTANANYCLHITNGSYYEQDPGWLFQTIYKPNDNPKATNGATLQAWNVVLPLVELKKSAKLEKVNGKWNFVTE